METCHSCGKELPGEFPFCPFCRAPLSEQPSASVLEERKVVSVLFCDLVGFTTASDDVDPEDVRARIRPYHSRLREEIERFGGTVEKFVGDAVMAVFGAPVAHEDDAERAVRAALRILEAIEELNAEDASLALQVRVGINTGEAMAPRSQRPKHYLPSPSPRPPSHRVLARLAVPSALELSPPRGDSIPADLLVLVRAFRPALRRPSAPLCA